MLYFLAMQENAKLIHDILRARRSIRKFKPDPIPDDALERILTSACWAPSAMNRQPWQFIVLTDEMRDRFATLQGQIFELMEDEIRERYGEEGVTIRRELYHNLGNAPIAVACFSDLKDGAPEFVSCALACENLLIAAWAEGIGSLPMTSSLRIKDEISFLCGIDTKKQGLVVILLLGYADGIPDPPERRKGRVKYYSNPRDIKT